MNIALIKAGGSGTRMGANIPKQFILVKGKPIIIYTLEAFEAHPNIDEIIVICLDGWQDVLQSYADKYRITKLKHIVTGGNTSLKSIQAGVKFLSSKYDHTATILIHDGNRPMVSEEIISDVLAQSNIYGSAVAAIPCTDEVMVSENNSMEAHSFLDHKVLFRIQTPDAYKLGTLIELFKHSTEEQLVSIGATNTLMLEQGECVHLAQGSEINIRLTKQEDILLFESLFEMKVDHDNQKG